MAEQGQGFVPGRHRIESYGGGGFRFAEMSHRGSLLALPSGIHALEAVAAEQIDEATLAPLFAEPAGAVELLIFGSGENSAPALGGFARPVEGCGNHGRGHGHRGGGAHL